MSYYKELLLALKFEMKRYKTLCVLLFSVVLLGVISVGMSWPRTYKADALLYADVTSIIEPLLKGRAAMADIDRSEKAQELIYTRRILEKVAIRAGLADEHASAKEIDAAIQRLRSTIYVKGEGKNYFRVTYYNSDPDLTYDVLTTLIESFIEDRTREKIEDSSSAFNFIDSQVKTYKRQLEQAEAKLKKFKAQSLNVTEESVKRRIADLTSEIQNLRINIQETETKISTTKVLLSQESQYLNVQSKLRALKDKKRSLSSELDKLRLAYQDSYPDIVSIKAQLAEVDAAISAMNVSDTNAMSSANEPLFEELRKQLSLAEVNLESQRRRLESLNGLLEEEFVRAEKVASDQAELTELTRDYDVTKDIYEEMLGRKENAKLSMALNMEGQGENYRVVESPVYPTKPHGINFLHFVIAAPVLAIGIPLGLLLVYVLLDPRIRSVTKLLEVLPKDLELLGVVPHFESSLAARMVRRDILVAGCIGLVAVIGYSLIVYEGLAVIGLGIEHGQ